jgi:hypothetical protein
MPTHTYHGSCYTAEFLLAAGVVTWYSSGNVPPADCLAEIVAQYPALPIDVDACTAERNRQNREAAAAYRACRRAMTPAERAEELYEMRAAFGPGATVVNALTGEITNL